MRGRILLWLSLVAACTKETPYAAVPDGPTGNHPPPRILAGGGIGDGAIDGVANLYVIDDNTRLPVVNATVQVGTVAGVTDATGLFIAAGVVGPQTVVVKATGYRSELWIGANGANLTVNVKPSVDPVVKHADLAGQITGFAAITVAANHIKVGVVSYSQSDDLTDAANNIKTVGDTNVCFPATPGAGCPFKITTRVGKLGLIAAIFDRDTKGTADPSDDTSTLIRWASRSAIDVTDGASLTGQDLTLIPTTDTQPVNIDFGTPPAALGTVNALIGIETAGDGVYQLPAFKSLADSSLTAPKLAALNATGYRLTGIAASDPGANAIQSIVLRRALPGTTLQANPWMPPPSGATVTRSSASWARSDATAVTSVEYTQGTATLTRLLNVTVFDNATTSMTVPAMVALPTTGVIDAKLQTIGATGLDVHNFSIDAERQKLDRVAALPITLTN